MKLKNYTSEVSAERTAAKIEELLQANGVREIRKVYGPTAGEVVGLSFVLVGAMGPMTVDLPVRVNECHKVLWKDYVGGDKVSTDGNYVSWGTRKKRSRQSFYEQARRTAWKITQDWLEIQMVMIQMGQKEMEEVFLADIRVGGQTMFEAYKNQRRLLAAPKSIPPIEVITDL